MWRKSQLLRMPLVRKPRDWLPDKGPPHKLRCLLPRGMLVMRLRIPSCSPPEIWKKALQKALDNQRKEMEASFVRLKASASESQTSSGAAPRSPQATFVHPGSEAPLQRGGPYQCDYTAPKLVEPKYNFNRNPPVLTENTNFLDWKSLMADYLRFVCERMWNLIDSGKGYYPVDPNNLNPSELFDRHLNQIGRA